LKFFYVFLQGILSRVNSFSFFGAQAGSPQALTKSALLSYWQAGSLRSKEGIASAELIRRSGRGYKLIRSNFMFISI
jgi:hypothetical protein